MTTNMHSAEWECLYPDIDWFRESHLPKLLGTLPALHKTIWTGPETLVTGHPADVVSILAEYTGNLRHLAVVLTNTANRRTFAHVLCPFVADAAEVEVTVTAITERTAGLEAVVTAEWENHAVPFFDPLYHFNRHRYHIGQKHDVRLAALCFDVRPQRTKMIEIDDPEQAKRLRRALEMPADKPVNFSLEGIVTSMPGDDDPEYASFTSPIKELNPVNANGFALQRAVIALARGEDDLDIPMFIPNHIAANHANVKLGDTAEGIYWVQGTLAETHALIAGAGGH